MIAIKYEKGTIVSKEFEEWNGMDDNGLIYYTIDIVNGFKIGDWPVKGSECSVLLKGADQWECEIMGVSPRRIRVKKIKQEQFNIKLWQ